MQEGVNQYLNNNQLDHFKQTASCFKVFKNIFKKKEKKGKNPPKKPR